MIEEYMDYDGNSVSKEQATRFKYERENEDGEKLIINAVAVFMDDNEKTVDKKLATQVRLMEMDQYGRVVETYGEIKAPSEPEAHVKVLGRDVLKPRTV